MGFGRSPIGVRIYQGGSLSSDTSNYRIPISNGPDRKRELELDCMEISVRSGGSRTVGFGRFPIGVSICQGGPVSPGTLNYRTPMGKRPRSKAETGTGMSGNISYARVFRASGLRAFPDQCNHLPGRFCSSYTSDCRTPIVKRDRSKAEAGTGMSGNISFGRKIRPGGFRALPDRCRRLTGRFCFSRHVEL